MTNEAIARSEEALKILAKCYPTRAVCGAILRNERIIREAKEKAPKRP